MRTKRKPAIPKSTDLVEDNSGWPELIFWIIAYLVTFAFLLVVFIFPPMG